MCGDEISVEIGIIGEGVGVGVGVGVWAGKGRFFPSAVLVLWAERPSTGEVPYSPWKAQIEAFLPLHTNCTCRERLLLLPQKHASIP